MLTLRPPLPALMAAAGVAAALAVAAPAGATEGPAAPPPAPWGLTAPSIAPGAFGPLGSAPAFSAPSTSTAHRRPGIRGARLVPHRIRKGKRATLRLSLPQAGKVKYTIRRMSAPHRGRVITRTVAAKQGKVSIRLPRGLASGRYRVSVVALDSLGSKSRTVSRSLIVRSAHR